MMKGIALLIHANLWLTLSLASSVIGASLHHLWVLSVTCCSQLYAELNLLLQHVSFYKVNMFMFYNVQTTCFGW